MKKMALLAAVFLVCGGGLSWADQPGKDWMSIDQAKAKLRADGYTNVTTIEADDGHYEGEGVKNGKVYEFHLDPHTGALTKDEVKD